MYIYIHIYIYKYNIYVPIYTLIYSWKKEAANILLLRVSRFLRSYDLEIIFIKLIVNKILLKESLQNPISTTSNHSNTKILQIVRHIQVMFGK